MNGFDQQKAARVWQRVQQAQPREKEPGHLEELPEWQMNAWTLAATYRRLAAGAQGSVREILGQLARQEQKQVARLAGIRLLITGETQAPPALNLPKEPLERALRRCFGMHLRNMKAWEAQSDHPEYGAIFGELARQQRDQCILVLELLGSFGGRKENNR